MPYTEMENITPTKLALISERARKEPKLQFISLAHLLNERFLKECYYSLGRDRASGMDGVLIPILVIDCRFNPRKKT